MREREVLLQVSGVRRAELRRWIAQGWVLPERRAGDFWFREIDVARVRRVSEIRRDMAVAEEGVPMVLSLLDQVYGLRDQLCRLAEAVEAQPSDVRKAISEHPRAR
jgi:chaperone modulatory protein CbpM